ncbi:GDSL-type esterase/lipase family protein [Algoriphagus hitonicola]|uniref:Lysophospholipase L1 n=1 Tax=Algoriphagus hitonicola TaxID=435880 RepID=A0A1I2NN98_9BACT|nr:GDSL-type esterase/lipase family protein [Algoriphagus hitonicola]SFG05053.1 Lysophospholipase L1 [Algoriphagus hitonicola]
MKKFIGLFSYLILLSLQIGFCQTNTFDQEVRKLTEKIDSLVWAPGSTIFTGSSTIRMWSDLAETFPNHELLNTGFGGSQAKDLQRHLFPLVLKYEPARVFIYEGDNDIWADVPTEEIMETFEDIISRIHLANPQTEIYLIGAKPSPSRWEKESQYRNLNQQLLQLSKRKEKVNFVDTWAALTDTNGQPRPELYLNDQLHLNAEGYQIWESIFKPYFD